MALGLNELFCLKYYMYVQISHGFYQAVWTLYRRRVPGAGTRSSVPLVYILDSYLDLYPTFAYISTNVTIFSVRPIYVSQLKTLIYKITLQMTSNKTNETQIM